MDKVLNYIDSLTKKKTFDIRIGSKVIYNKYNSNESFPILGAFSCILDISAPLLLGIILDYTSKNHYTDIRRDLENYKLTNSLVNFLSWFLDINMIVMNEETNVSLMTNNNNTRSAWVFIFKDSMFYAIVDMKMSQEEFAEYIKTKIDPQVLEPFINK